MEPQRPSLADNDDEIHLWKIDLGDSRWDAFAGTLSVDELARAGRFKGPALQENYRRCRGALRHILASYLHSRPEKLRFRYGRFGKPELDGAGVHFNLSHSRHLAIVGTSTHRLGVDLEYRKSLLELGGLIKIVCSTEEKNTLYALPPAEQQEQFYRIWVRKEAFCKAVGTGLQSGLTGIDIGPQGRIICRGASLPDFSGEEALYVHDLTIAEGYSAGLCTALAEPRIVNFSAKPDY